ncbi:Cytosolic sulfotransferase 8 [Bienertia sinuspersici]
MPKTGTTWFKSLLFSLFNRSNNGLLDTPLQTHNPHELILSLEITIYAKDKNPVLTKMPSPRLFSTHLPYDSLPESVKNSNVRSFTLLVIPLTPLCRHGITTQSWRMSITM